MDDLDTILRKHWPESWNPRRDAALRDIDGYIVKREQALLKGLLEHEIPVIKDYPQGFQGVPSVVIQSAINNLDREAPNAK